MEHKQKTEAISRAALKKERIAEDAYKFDTAMAAYCRTLPSPLREDIAAIIQWDHKPEFMPLTKQVAKIYGIMPPRNFASRSDVIAGLIGAGYAPERAKFRASSEIDYNAKSRADSAKRRYRQKMKGKTNVGI